MLGVIIHVNGLSGGATTCWGFTGLGTGASCLAIAGIGYILSQVLDLGCLHLFGSDRYTRIPGLVPYIKRQCLMIPLDSNQKEGDFVVPTILHSKTKLAQNQYKTVEVSRKSGGDISTITQYYSTVLGSTTE
jgi:hypothetical protein